MILVLLVFFVSMLCYLLHEMSLAKIKKSFEEQIQNLTNEKTEILREFEGLKAKEMFYSHLSAQLEKKNEEIVELSSKIAKLETKLNLKP
jgi:peptidoglycan hydrolase CwlO-like protein